MFIIETTHCDLLEYRLDDEEANYPTFFHLKGISPDEIHTRKLCEFFVYNDTVFVNSFTALEENCHVIYVKKDPVEEGYDYPIIYNDNELCIEVRKAKGIGKREIIHSFDCHSHSEALSFATSDIIYIEGVEYRHVSFEIDQDRRVYVMYVKPSK